MKRRLKVGRNDECPCGSGKKFKHCCEGQVDWNRILRSGSPEWKEHLSVRGKNLLFLERICEALQFDREPAPDSLADFKSAFTPQAVRQINEAVVEIWPRETDINSVLQSTKADVSSLYVGEYRRELLVRGVTRHSLYANKILLVDPFIYPFSVRDEYNPILHPERHRTTTLRNVDIWVHFMRWIEAGIVEFIRTPDDFDPELKWESLERQRQKYKENAGLRALLEETAQIKAKQLEEREAFRMVVLSASDDYLRSVFRSLNLGTNTFGEDAFIAHIHELRRGDPCYLGPIDGTHEGEYEFHIVTTGASYDIAKLTASLTGSYLVTDIASRWKEIELDRLKHGVGMGEWSALAKAFHNLDLNYLNNLNLSHALSLRNEGRLQNMRAFLRRLWTVASSGNPFGEENVQLLADELEANVAKAKEEWKQIDRDLIKWVGAEAGTALLAAGPLITSGHAGFLAAAVAAASSTTFASTAMMRRGFPNKFPAAFFMDLAGESKGG